MPLGLLMWAAGWPGLLAAGPPAPGSAALRAAAEQRPAVPVPGWQLLRHLLCLPQRALRGRQPCLPLQLPPPPPCLLPPAQQLLPLTPSAPCWPPG